MTIEVCQGCSEPVENEDGTLWIRDGLCECCYEHREWVALKTDMSDFDYSMNY